MEKIYWKHLPQTHICYAIAKALENTKGPLLLIAANSSDAYKFKRELSFFTKDVEVLNFPDWEILPYDSFSPHADIVADRITTLYKLKNIEKGIIIVSIDTVLQRLCPVDFVLQTTLSFALNDKLDVKKLILQLNSAGYYKVDQVRQYGEYAVRGSILDLFPIGSSLPLRIDLFDDEIDNIRTFDTESQRSLSKISEVNILPAKEFPVTDEGIQKFRDNWRNTFERASSFQCQIYKDISQHVLPQGIEYYLPLFFDETATIFDYLPENTTILQSKDLNLALDEFYSQMNHRYEQYRHDIQRPILSPHELFLPENDFFGLCKQYEQIVVTENEKHLKHAIDFQVEKIPDIAVSRSSKELEKISKLIDGFTGRIFFSAESKGRQEILLELLAKVNIRPEVCNWHEFLENNTKFAVGVAPLDEGIIIKDLNIMLICEADLLGQQVMQRRRRESVKIELEILNLTELKEGDLVVHIEHGVAVYKGLKSLAVGNLPVEFVVLEYAEEDKLYVPVTSLHLISRYSGGNSENAPLYKLGGDKWQKAKQKALKKIEDVAAELLELYAKREAKGGRQMQVSPELYEEFAGKFPFEETVDQIRAIQDVIEDLTANKSMDRVVCGDVGFGKTEVAMRAAFIAVQNDLQVIVLVPTTLLAGQHYQTFIDRFADFPVKIEVLSRFKTSKEQKKVIEDLKNNKLDIVIGTHKLLSDDVKVNNLGLIIIDEEHRFGVKQKEKLKKMRAEVDILTLTATPIPRTLNMSMSGIRDLSIIATPPAKRLSIKTFVRNHSSALIEEAVQRELHRGGQVYYVHNSVDTIEQTAMQLQNKMPYAKVVVAHGQMRERELEQIMFDFYHMRYNVLVCTTIIETGIDIPTANTMIIDRADKFGLAQLHQLRGRIGRSHHQAYAFLLTPSSITKDAEKRLEAIEMSDKLGSGFTLATHDLEIRGAGELLGDSQSGHIQLIGFTLFAELLDRAVKNLKSGKTATEEETNVEIDLQVPALIPGIYMPDVSMRLVFYKRIASCKSNKELDELSTEMLDRFGLLPDSVKYLIKITKYKLKAKSLGIQEVKLGMRSGLIKFIKNPKINLDKMLIMIKEAPDKYQFAGPSGIKITGDMPKFEDRFKVLDGFLAAL